MKPRIIILWVFLLTTATGVGAHKLAPSLLDVQEVSGNHYDVVWKTPRDAATKPMPVFPEQCRRGETTIQPLDSALTWHWRIHCPAGLAGQSISIVSLADSRSAALLRYRSIDNTLQQQLITAADNTATLHQTGRSTGLLKRYFFLGGKHILIGLDHLLFITGLLLLASNWRNLVKTVTAFTLGHSVTLALVSLKLIPQWSALIEFGIAITILVLASELATPVAPKPSLLRRFQWPVAALFGLVHGLGFAGVLQELGLPADNIVPALLAFNLGIEAGQLLFVAGLAILLEAFQLRSTAMSDTVRQVGVLAMGGIAFYWCLDRGLSLLFGVV